MAKAQRATAEETAELISEPITESIVYVPLDGDRISITWCGHTFQANIPKEITGCATGTEREKLNFHLIERARENKHFVVGNAKRKRDSHVEPKTALEYRAYAVAWMKDPEIKHAEDLIARFARDRELQASCEIGYDDFEYLGTLFNPRLSELAHGDELNAVQVSQIWINHGYNVLPW